MQAITRSFLTQAALVGNRRTALRSAQALSVMNQRRFATAEIEVKKRDETAVDAEQVNKRLGVDTQFSEQKHAYVLTFPWNFQEIINDYETEARPLPTSNYWYRFVMNNAEYEINNLFREFHQACALPDYGIIDKVCEGKLAQYVKDSVRRIHFHGLDIEMANLTVEQPQIKVLKVEVSHGVSLDRSQNKPESEYNITKNTLMGGKQTVYVPKQDQRSWLDHLDYNYKPYVVAATLLIESPMKLYV